MVGLFKVAGFKPYLNSGMNDISISVYIYITYVIYIIYFIYIIAFIIYFLILANNP